MVIVLGSEDNFTELWKAYMKEVGKTLGLKGKGLFHPVRLALTGRMSGPDVGDQLVLIHSAASVLNPSFPYVPLMERINYLKTLNIAESKIRAEKAAATIAEELAAKQSQEAPVNA